VKALRSIVSLAALAGVLAGCRGPLPSSELEWRRQREVAVREALPVLERTTFAGLRFYAYDPDVRFRVMLERVDAPRQLRLAASDGSVRPAHRVGRVRLDFPGGVGTLNVYGLDDVGDPSNLFLPFRDAGAGSATYGGGRYVDVERLPGGVLEIDFNRAYNPDCAYGVTAQCPIAPEENALPFKVEAGEMMPLAH
jgi:uncharacterized protein (DUF1684 family)